MEPVREIFAVCQASDLVKAPCAGYVLLRVDENGKSVPWPILIVRSGKKYFGYVNRCPHQGTRLDFEPKQFLDPTHRFLLCGKHGAQFDIPTGHCIQGPCQGERLEPVELVLDDGDICVAGVRLAEEDGLDLAEPDEMPEVLIQPD